MTPGEWKARLFARTTPPSRPTVDRWHRVDGAEDVIALVKSPQDAIAIAALPEVVGALEDMLDDADADCVPVASRSRARAALLALRGEK